MSAIREGLTIREGVESDTPVIFDFIRKLAEYERLLHAVVATEEAVRETMFGQRRYAEALLAEWEGRPAGMALFFHTYSTFRARPGIWLEDLFVEPVFRGRGIGKALLVRLAGVAVDRGCARVDWNVLNWNEPAIGFYRRIGATPLDAWTTYRLTGTALEELARQ